MGPHACTREGRFWFRHELQLYPCSPAIPAVENRGDIGVETEVEVRKHDVAVGAKEDVLGLQVTVNETEGVEVLECEEDLSGVEFDGGKRKAMSRSVAEEGVEISAGAVVNEEAGVVRGVESGVEGGEKGVVEASKNAGLGSYVRESTDGGVEVDDFESKVEVVEAV